MPPATSLKPKHLLAALSCWLPDRLDEEAVLGSAEERLAAQALLLQVGGQGGRLLPQASLDQLARSWGRDAAGDRRLDFLLLDDDRRPLCAVEVDGRDHVPAAAVDRDRDQLLRMLGVTPRRVLTEEVRQGQVPALAGVAAPGASDPLVAGPLAIDRLFLSLMEALGRGFLLGDEWVVELEDETSLATVGLPVYLGLLSAVDALWAGKVAPRRVPVQRPGQPAESWQRDGWAWEPIPARESAPDVRVVLELDNSPLHQLPAQDELPTIVVRTATLPVPLLTRASEPRVRIPRRVDDADLKQALRLVVREIFDKPDFPDGQLEGIMEVVAGRDCVVLLPTGAGKSLIYQVAGMVLPGRTIVVDPLVALMEDQVRGLGAYGIDRVAAVSSQTTATGRMASTLEEVSSGDALFVFISPERLQQQSFRDAMRELAQTTPINLAVVEETHCVSEWGHDFRTAYLRLGSVLRQVCRDPVGAAPPLLALTGTASRAVLRDVLVELDIQAGASTLVKPRGFDRKELSFEIVRTTPAEAQASFLGLLRSLPGRFGLPPEDFFAAQGDRTFSGLVFAPHTNGPYGVKELADKVSAALGQVVLPYAGGAPKGVQREDWEVRKRANAAAFIGNQVPILVTTKAFGMGIDKPNIRFVVHLGIPSSIEAYYQEVGRAGRDRRPAQCLLLFSQFSEQVTRAKLDADIDIEHVRAQSGASSRRTADDIDRQLFFHLNSFAGVEAEVTLLEEVQAELGDLGHPTTLSISMGGTDNGRERAIHRLVMLAVVEDYLVDWGGRRFDLVLTGASGAAIVEALLRYIEQAQPGRAAAYQLVVDKESWAKPEVAVRGCARLLIAFVYDTVERARRRSLREMWLAAHESADDADLRGRILNYLSEGDIAPVLERLAEQRTFTYSDWTSAMATLVHAAEAHEWRGTTARLLGSYPDHPGLLARCVSELVDPDGSLGEAGAALASSIDSARSRYGADDAAITLTLDWAMTRCAEQHDVDAAVVVAAVAREHHPEWVAPAIVGAEQNPAAAVLTLEAGLARLVSILDDLTIGGSLP